jgi:hypothetical protein
MKTKMLPFNGWSKHPSDLKLLRLLAEFRRLEHLTENYRMTDAAVAETTIGPPVQYHDTPPRIPSSGIHSFAAMNDPELRAQNASHAREVFCPDPRAVTILFNPNPQEAST